MAAERLEADARWHHLPNPVGPSPDSRIAAEQNDLFLFVGRLSLAAFRSYFLLPPGGRRASRRDRRGVGSLVEFG